MLDESDVSLSSSLGALLLRERVISADALKLAQTRVQQTGGPLSVELVRLGLLDEQDIVQALVKRYQLPSVNLEDVQIDPAILKMLPYGLVDRHDMIPISLNSGVLTVAMADPSNLHGVDDAGFATGRKIDVVVAPYSQIRAFIEKHYLDSISVDDAHGREEEPSDLKIDIADEEAEVILEDDAPIITLVNYMITQALKRRASDIHIEPFERFLRIRYRIDGELQQALTPPMKLHAPIVARVKVMAKLDISEHRLPQDGSVKLRVGRARQIGLRVAIIPTRHGESAVLRILDEANLQLDLTKLGLNLEERQWFEEAIGSPHGLVLVTGPTGSGKTTTLYSALAALNRDGIKILTVEDPIEYGMDRVAQVQVNEATGLTFAAAMRSFLRMDPDVILVGEVRDYETAEIAVKASLTGHLVLSTLHTNSAVDTVSRLVQMGLEPYLVAQVLRLVVAQRLVKRLCMHCAEPTPIAPQRLMELGMEPEDARLAHVKQAKGCAHCGHTGYSGRIAIYEMLRFTPEVCELVLLGTSARDIRAQALRQGMRTLRGNALSALAQGITSIEEVLRATANDS